MIILDIKRSLGGKNLDPLPAVVYKQQFRQKGYKIPVPAVGVNCSCYHYKSCHLQFLHTKAIAALTQFCDFFYKNWDFRVQPQSFFNKK